MGRNGIISAGNWLVDTVKTIDAFPAQGNLTTIRHIDTGLGGCSHNVLADIAGMKTGIPLYAGGYVGNDENGRYVLSEIRRLGIDGKFMHISDEVQTSYTDVMSEAGGKKTRTFFHFRGANALLSPEDIMGMDCNAKIFHLGYLLLLDKLDAEDPDFGTGAARALHGLQEKGYLTSVDLVSEESDRFRKIVSPCLKYIDFLIINEIEAGAICCRNLRGENGEILLEDVKTCADELINAGVRNSCIIHFPEGGFAMDKDGNRCFCPSVKAERGEIVSTVGAGDAFCAGMLVALHEEMPLDEALKIANASARFNLSSPTSTGGAPDMQTIMNFIKENY